MAENIKTEIDCHRITNPSQVEGMTAVVTALAVTLKKDNPAFDRTRFLTACGL